MEDIADGRALHLSPKRIVPSFNETEKKLQSLRSHQTCEKYTFKPLVSTWWIKREEAGGRSISHNMFTSRIKHNLQEIFKIHLDYFIT